jgi:hypothetical protein
MEDIAKRLLPVLYVRVITEVTELDIFQIQFFKNEYVILLRQNKNG